MSILECKNLSKAYKKGVYVINDMNIEIPRGKIVGLLGPNGCGKSTLIKMIAGVLQPTNGEITVDGCPVGEDSKALVSYLPERTYFNNSMKVSELLNYFEEFYSDFDKERAYKLLSDLKISPNSNLKSLSKGTKEKVQLVLVMARKAKLYLLDEPIAGVDPVAREYILDTIVSNYNKEATVIVSTHLIADVEPVLDDFLFVHRGRVLMRGEVAEAKAKYGKTLDELFREVYKKCSANV